MTFETAVRWLLIYGILGLGVLALIVWTVIRADNPVFMVLKWILTLLVVAFMIFFVAPLVGKLNFDSAFVGVPLAAFCGIALTFLWRHELVDLVANPIGALYDGGSVPPEPAPAYSVAQARQKSGRYLEAITEVRKQLEMFPTDLEGHMLLASVQAEALKDLPSAEQTIMSFCAQEGHTPRALTYALYALADWHLAINKDPEGARRALERLVELLPETEFALGARQRIAHLGDPRAMAADAERKLHLPQSTGRDFGLHPLPADQQPAPRPPGELAAESVRHLELHPMDNEVREKLAILYVDHYHRLDLATAELEQIIRTPHQPGRVVTHCLNVLADLQKRSGESYETIRATLERIPEYDPRSAAAEVARRRIDLLKLELKSNAAKDSVKLGVYEQDIGLRRPR